MKSQEIKDVLKEAKKNQILIKEAGTLQKISETSPLLSKRIKQIQKKNRHIAREIAIFSQALTKFFNSSSPDQLKPIFDKMLTQIAQDQRDFTYLVNEAKKGGFSQAIQRFGYPVLYNKMQADKNKSLNSWSWIPKRFRFNSYQHLPLYCSLGSIAAAPFVGSQKNSQTVVKSTAAAVLLSLAANWMLSKASLQRSTDSVTTAAYRNVWFSRNIQDLMKFYNQEANTQEILWHPVPTPIAGGVTLMKAYTLYVATLAVTGRDIFSLTYSFNNKNYPICRSPLLSVYALPESCVIVESPWMDRGKKLDNQMTIPIWNADDSKAGRIAIPCFHYQYGGIGGGESVENGIFYQYGRHINTYFSPSDCSSEILHFINSSEQVNRFSTGQLCAAFKKNDSEFAKGQLLKIDGDLYNNDPAKIYQDFQRPICFVYRGHVQAIVDVHNENNLIIEEANRDIRRYKSGAGLFVKSKEQFCQKIEQLSKEKKCWFFFTSKVSKAGIQKNNTAHVSSYKESDVLLSELSKSRELQNNNAVIELPLEYSC